MVKWLNLQRLVFLNENISNPICDCCKNELSGFLISDEELINSFSPEDIGFLLQKKYLEQSKEYAPKLIIFLCRTCCKRKENNDEN